MIIEKLAASVFSCDYDLSHDLNAVKQTYWLHMHDHD